MWSSMAKSFPSVNVVGSMSKVMPVVSISCFQWRLRRASRLRSSIRGRLFWKPTIVDSTGSRIGMRPTSFLTLVSSSTVPLVAFRSLPMSSSAHRTLLKLSTF